MEDRFKHHGGMTSSVMYIDHLRLSYIGSFYSVLRSTSTAIVAAS